MSDQPDAPTTVLRQGTPHETVAECNAFSAQLKETPLNVKLHVSAGNTAEGTISLDGAPGKEGTQLVVSARSSALFGVVGIEHRHAFNVGEVERLRSTHTVFLLRSVRHLCGGNDAEVEEMLARSLSLFYERKTVDITCESKEDCDGLGEWIDAERSAVVTQKSVRRNSRISLALQGRRKTLEAQGVYDAIEEVRGQERGAGDGAGDEGGGAGDVGESEFTVLPVLEDAVLHKLQDDLVDGVHVTYHKMSLGGFFSSSSPRLLRYDYLSGSKGLVYLESSFEGDAESIAHPMSDLLQVGGGPSAHAPTSGLLRATQGDPEQRAGAFSLVFKNGTMNITCSPQNARELVLLFSAVRGFKLGAPRSRSVTDLVALPNEGDLGHKKATGTSGPPGAAGSRPAVDPTALPSLRGGVVGHKEFAVAWGEEAGSGSAVEADSGHGSLPLSSSALLPTSSEGAGAASPAGGHNHSDGNEGGGDGGGGGGDGGAAARQSKHAHRFSSRFRDGMEGGEDGEDEKVRRGQVRAASGFGMALVPGATTPLPESITVRSVNSGKFGGGRGSPSLVSPSAAAASVISAGTRDKGKRGDGDEDGGGGGGDGLARRLNNPGTISSLSLDGADDKEGSRKALVSGQDGDTAGGGGGGDSVRRLNISPTFSSRFRDGTEEEGGRAAPEKTDAASRFSLSLLREESRKALLDDAAARARGDGSGGGGGGGGTSRRLNNSATFSSRFADGTEDEEDEKVEEEEKTDAASGFSLHLLKEESRKALLKGTATRSRGDGSGGGGGGGTPRRLNNSATFSSQFLDGTKGKKYEEVGEKTDAASGFGLHLLKEESRKALLKGTATRGRGDGSGGGGGGGGNSRRLSSSATFSSRFADGTEDEEDEKVEEEEEEKMDAASGFSFNLLKEESRKTIPNDAAKKVRGHRSGGDTGQRLNSSLTFTSRFQDGTEAEQAKEKRRLALAKRGFNLKLVEESRNILARDAAWPLSQPAVTHCVDAGKPGCAHGKPSLASSSLAAANSARGRGNDSDGDGDADRGGDGGGGGGNAGQLETPPTAFASRFRDGAEAEKAKAVRRERVSARGFTLKLLGKESGRGLFPRCLDADNDGGGHGSPSFGFPSAAALVKSAGARGNGAGDGGVDGGGLGSGGGSLRRLICCPAFGLLFDGGIEDEENEEPLRWTPPVRGGSSPKLRRRGGESERGLVPDSAARFSGQPVLQRKWQIREKSTASSVVAWSLPFR